MLKPINSKILVKKLEDDNAEEKTASGVILAVKKPDAMKDERLKRYEIVDIYEPYFDQNSNMDRKPMDNIKVGKVIVADKFSVSTIFDNGEEFGFLKEADIFAIED